MALAPIADATRPELDVAALDALIERATAHCHRLQGEHGRAAATAFTAG